MKVYSEISTDLATWIEAQHVFFIATAPLSEKGHVNLSPRGLDSLRVVSPNQIAILDLTGSGNESAAHMMENGRVTVMFCAFSDKPRILRLFGKGAALPPSHAQWNEYRPLFDESMPGVRQIFRIDVDRVQTSCGFGVPLMDFVANRTQLTEWAVKKGEEELVKYREENNSRSIDGLSSPA